MRTTAKAIGKRLDLDYYYSTARDCALPQEAPKDIRLLWETAQHLLAYAYFEYSFVITADYLSTQVVEIALRKECAAQIAEFNRQRAGTGEKNQGAEFPRGFGVIQGKDPDDLGAGGGPIPVGSVGRPGGHPESNGASAIYAALPAEPIRDDPNQRMAGGLLPGPVKTVCPGLDEMEPRYQALRREPGLPDFQDFFVFCFNIGAEEGLS